MLEGAEVVRMCGLRGVCACVCGGGGGRLNVCAEGGGGEVLVKRQ